MQTHPLFSKQNFWHAIVLFFPLFLIFSLSSCKEKAPKGSTIALTKAKIKSEWVKNDLIKNIDYIAFITCYNPIKHEISVSAQAFSKDYKELGKFFQLVTGDAWKDTLPPVGVAVTYLDFASLEILNDKEELKEFSYINLSPYGKDGFLYFKTTVIDDEGRTQSATTQTAYPCPPCINCKPMCPPNCTPPCEKVDSTATIDSTLR